MEKTTLLWGNLHLLFIIYFDQRPEIDIWNLLDILIDKKSKKNIFDFYYFQNKEKFKFLKILSLQSRPSPGSLVENSVMREVKTKVNF